MSTEHQHIAERFKKDTADHEMTVLHDDGLYRHLRFQSPARGTYWFDLITWPGSLTIRGDLGNAYTFSRELDMFPFFRSRTGGINPHYWAQKLDNPDGAVRYDEEIFKARVKEHVVDAIRGGWAPRGIGKAVHTEIVTSDLLGDEHEARKLLEDFDFGGGHRAECAT